MEKKKYYWGMIFLGFLLALQITACGSKGDDAGSAPTSGKPFVTVDLAGTWYMYGTNVANGVSTGILPVGSIVAGNIRGKLILDALGQVAATVSSFTSPTNSAFFTGGLISMDSSGAVTGSAATNLGVNFYFDSGKMDSTKNILSFVVHTSNEGHYLITAIRAIGGFSSLDLAATWHVFGAGGDYGQITVSDAGNGIRATIASPGGGGFFAIDGNGLLNDTSGYVGTSFVSAGSDLILKQGKISFTKDVMFFVAGTDLSTYDLVTAVRGGGTFATADLAGTWQISGAISNSADSTKNATLTGTASFDSSGKATGGSYTRSNAAGKISFTGGTTTIDSAGVLGGSAATDAGGNISFASGKMNAAKGMMSLVGSTGGGEQVFFFGIKVN